MEETGNLVCIISFCTAAAVAGRGPPAAIVWEGAYGVMPGKREARGHEIREKIRPLRCVQCGWRILDAVGDARIRLFALTEDRCPDFIVKCGHCGAEIGVLKIE